MSNLTLALYNRDIIDVPFVIRSIDIISYDRSKNPRNDLTRRMLQLRISRYLLGRGHVKSPLISAEDFEAEKDSDTLRAKLLLKCATDSTLIDPEDFGITVITFNIYLFIVYLSHKII